MKKTVIEELFVLRALACLSILVYHATNRAFPDGPVWIELLEVFLAFGTPAYVFISEIILANAYPNETPKGFWKKRVEFIFVPYLTFGALYAVLKSGQEWAVAGNVELSVLGGYLWRHLLLGDYHGYFILIIFQFYALHSVFGKIAKRFSPVAILTASLFIQAGYLLIFNLVPAPNGTVWSYVWGQLSWLPFAGWLFYFTVAYYCGRDYSRFRAWLERYGVWTIPATLLCGAIVAVVFLTGIVTTASSKRFDMILFTLSLSFFICYAVLRTRFVPNALVAVSRYSFGIYLLHPLFFGLLAVPIGMFQASLSPVIQLLLYISLGLAASILTTRLLNRTRWGGYLVGKLGLGRSKPEREQPDRPHSGRSAESMLSR